MPIFGGNNFLSEYEEAQVLTCASSFAASCQLNSGLKIRHHLL